MTSFERVAALHQSRTPDLDPAAKHVLAIIATYANNDSGEAWPSARTIAAAAGYAHPRHVLRQLAVLVRLGWLVVVRKGTERSRTPTIYRVNLTRFGELARDAKDRARKANCDAGVTVPRGGYDAGVTDQAKVNCDAGVSALGRGRHSTMTRASREPTTEPTKEPTKTTTSAALPRTPRASARGVGVGSEFAHHVEALARHRSELDKPVTPDWKRKVARRLKRLQADGEDLDECVDAAIINSMDGWPLAASECGR